MRISRIRISNFGKIHDRNMELSDGLNVLFGENESGKTTIHTFLKSMFYGNARARGRKARTDVYSTYEPWENPGEYGGILWFSHGGENYRLSRNFDSGHQRFELMRESDGLVSDDPDDLAELLGEVSEAVYENTVSIGQLKSVTGPDLVRELQNYIAGYQGTGDTSLDLGRAGQMLKMSRKGYQASADRRRKELLKEQEKLDAGTDYLEKELQGLSQKSRETEEKNKSGRSAGTGEAIKRRIQDTQRSKTAGSLLLGLLGVLLVLLCFFLPDVRMKAASAAVGLLLFLAAWIRNRKLSGQIARDRRLYEKWKARNRKYRGEKNALTESINEKKRQIESLQASRGEIEELLAEPFPEDEDIEAVNLALETIEELSGGMSRQAGRMLQERTSRILGEITNGKYTDVRFDGDFRMTVNTGDRMVPLEGLSRGTLEQIYFAFRMAAGELFCGDESFPVVLDDIFGMYDEERLAAVLRWLALQDRQIIISTCSRREMELLDREGIEYQGILL